MAGNRIAADGTERCARGHDLGNPAIRYEEATPGGGAVVRCRTCRNAAARQRRTPVRGRVDIETLYKRQRPEDQDLRAAEERWLSGDGGRTLKRAGVKQADVARLLQVDRSTAAAWMKGQIPQRRYAPRAAALLAAADTLLNPLRVSPEPAEPIVTDTAIGDAGLIIGGRADRDGPWHASPPHTPALKADLEAALKVYHESGGTSPKWLYYWPSLGLLVPLETDKLAELLEAHAYLEHPDTGPLAERMMEADLSKARGGWSPPGPGRPRRAAYEARMLAQAAQRVHYADLLEGRGCRPGCAMCAAVRHGSFDPAMEEYDCPADCERCEAEGVAEMRASWADQVLSEV